MIVSALQSLKHRQYSLLNNLIKPQRIFQPSNSLKTFSNLQNEDLNEEKPGFFDKYLGPKSSLANDNFSNRWLMVPPAFLTHMCIGFLVDL